MKTYKKVPREDYVTILDTMSCDLCGEIAKFGDWSNECYVVEEVSVTYRTGSEYPEGSNTETYGFDICPDCFINTLIPWVESEGTCKVSKTTEDNW